MIFGLKAPLREANNFFKNMFLKLQEKEFYPYVIGDSCCMPDIFLADQFVSEELRPVSTKAVNECDLLIVNGVITEKMIPYIKDCYEQLIGPKYVIAYGACSVSGQPFDTIKLSDIIPVNIYVGGCSPGALSLKAAIIKLKEINKNIINKAEVI
jgi:NADH-quinone oxidoreductase subunit B